MRAPPLLLPLPNRVDEEKIGRVRERFREIMKAEVDSTVIAIECQRSVARHGMRPVILPLRPHRYEAFAIPVIN